MEKTTKDRILELLNTVDRKGMKDLIKWLEESDFFEAPASTRYHGSYRGGLADHSYNVYRLMIRRLLEYKVNMDKESLIIATILHDVCKINLYSYNGIGYDYNRSIGDKGHSERSIRLIEEHIELEEIEKNLIKYHMGFYGTEILEYAQEYTSKEYMDAINKEPIIMLMHHADNEESKFLGNRV